MLAVTLLVAFYLFAGIDAGGQGGYGIVSVSSVREVLANGMVTISLGASVVDAYLFSTFIFAALASTVFSRDISSGYMRVLLSYPIGRMRLFLSKVFTVLLVPFLIFTFGLTLSAFLGFSRIFTSVDPVNLAYVLLVMLIQMLFMLSISVTLSLRVRQPVMAFLGSLLILLGIQQFGDHLPSPFSSFLPSKATDVLTTYGQGAVFHSIYTSTDLAMSVAGLLIFPLALLAVDALFFKWRFQV
jgi:ABC-type transport system involved in multi-copper enzyme maturation permease subunit